MRNKILCKSGQDVVLPLCLILQTICQHPAQEYYMVSANHDIGQAENGFGRHSSAQDGLGSWKSPRSVKKISPAWELVLDGPLVDKEDNVKMKYLLLWAGEKGRDIFNTWTLSQADSKNCQSIMRNFKSTFSQSRTQCSHVTNSTTRYRVVARWNSSLHIFVC